LHRRVINEILSSGATVGMSAVNLCASSLPGTEGNREYFLHFRTGETGMDPSLLEQRLAEAIAP
jgi:predicted rRNA methylase YqxC with S4 and FtsJ domains